MIVIAALVATLLVLGAWLLVERGVIRPPTYAPPRRTGRGIALGALCVAAAEYPLLSAIPSMLAAPVLDGDARSHMVIATAIARRGIARGWIDVYQGGFPLGPHYPSLAWLVDAALIRLGVDPATATHALGLAALLAVPTVAYVAATRAGASALAATAGAVALAWVTPESGFVGGDLAYLRIGVMSQVCAMPFAVAFAASVLAGRARAAPAWLAAATMAAHPQIAMATTILVWIACFAIGPRAPWARCLRASFAAGAVGAALYGPGVATLGVPFAWPPMEGWQLLGFGPERLVWWLADGDLLDKGRAPLLTSAWAASAILLVARIPRPAARAALAMTISALLLAASGVYLPRLGAAGALLLTFVQPLRMCATLPAVAAACIVVAVAECLAWGPELARRLRVAPSVLGSLAVAQGLLALGIAGSVALPRRAKALRERARFDGAGCGERTPSGYDAREIASWLRSLQHGRLLYEDIGILGDCANRHELDAASAVPLATAPGAGAHVGVHWVAFRAVHPERSGSAARAEALGVRYVLHVTKDRPEDGDAWREIRSQGEVGLSERVGGTDAVGVGCVTETWRGSERELVAAALATFDRAPSRLDRPHELIALETRTGLLERAPAALDGCSATGAIVRESPREPGAFAAEVEAPSPVDVVVRAAAFPTWRVTVDGASVPWRRVLPGFLSVRVAAGRHAIVAETRPSFAYLAGIASALAVTAIAGGALTRLRGRRRGRGERALSPPP